MMRKMHALQLAAQLCMLTESIEDQRAVAHYLLDLVESYLAPQEAAPPAAVLRLVKTVPIREEVTP